MVGGNSGRNRVTPVVAAAAAPAAEPKAEAENKENDASNTAPAAAEQPAKAKKRSLEDLMGERLFRPAPSRLLATGKVSDGPRNRACFGAFSCVSVRCRHSRARVSPSLGRWIRVDR